MLSDQAAQDALPELLTRARTGDVAAREALFEIYRNYVSSVARSQMEPWMQAKVDASDIVQQSLLDAHRALNDFRGQTEGEWMAWLKQIVNRNTADFVRQYAGAEKRQIKREVSFNPPSGEDSAPGPQFADPGDSPSHIASTHERTHRLTQVMATLPADYQEVLRLRNLQQLPFDEVARIMGRSRPAVQMLWTRAVKRLAELMPEG